jgi:phospholipase/carboxylesterase
MPAAPVIDSLEARFLAAPQASPRLMVVLHGLGDSMAGFYWMPQMLGLPWLSYLLVNAPHPYFMGYAWYDIEQPEPGVLEGRGLLRRLFAELRGQGWAAADTVLFGFSQGCLMSLDFALRHDERLAGIVGVSGYAFGLERLPAELNPRAREQAWLVTHGTHDELLPIARTRAQMEQLRALGVPIEWHEFPKTHTIDPEAELALIRSWIAARWPAAPDAPASGNPGSGNPAAGKPSR